MEDFTRKLVTFSDGNQVLTESVDGLAMTVLRDDADVVSEQEIDVTPEQFKDMAEKAKTHSIEFGTISKELKLTPKEEIKADKPKTPPMKETTSLDEAPIETPELALDDSSPDITSELT